MRITRTNGHITSVDERALQNGAICLMICLVLPKLLEDVVGRKKCFVGKGKTNRGEIQEDEKVGLEASFVGRTMTLHKLEPVNTVGEVAHIAEGRSTKICLGNRADLR